MELAFVVQLSGCWLQGWKTPAPQIARHILQVGPVACDGLIGGPAAGEKPRI